MKTLNDLFIIEGMKDCSILAGHRGLSRQVQYVNISDTPDIIDFLDKDHLLLTTAYAFKDNIEKMCDLIRQMHELDCAGIVIKINRFLKKLPDEVRLLADQLSFPIIGLPSHHTLGDVSRHILNYLNDHEAEQLHYALHVHKVFSDMMFKGYDLPSLVEQLGHFLERPTLLLNHRGEIIAESHDFRKDSLKQVQDKVIQIIKSDIMTAREGNTYHITSHHEAIREMTSFPVQTKRAQASMLIIMDSDTLPYPSSQMAIEQAGNVISFTIIKEQAIEENTRLLKNNFFADLIENRIHSEKEIISRANYYGLEENMDNICLLCAIDTQADDYNQLQLYEKKVSELHHYIYDQLEDEIINGKINATLFTKEKYFAMIVQFKNYNKAKMEKIKTFVEKAQKNIENNFTVSFGISNPVQKLTDIPITYKEAVHALINGYESDNTSVITFYKTREIEELLSILPEKDLEELYKNTLKTLAFPETVEDVDLIKTIETYLDYQCNISETARKLYVHRNTVKYRIKKAESILQCSLHDPVESLHIRIALVIGSILEANG